MITIKHGSTDQSVYFVLVDSDGNEATGLTIANLDITYVRDRAAAVKADATALASATAAHGDNQAIEVDATNAPGLYRVDYPDAAFVSGVDRVQLIVNGAAIKPAIIEVSLVAKLVSDLIDAAAAPSAATVASQVRTELGTELGRIDVAISSRNATTPPTVGAIRTELEGASTKLTAIHNKLPYTYIADSDTLAVVNGIVSNLNDRLTAARAGYLDKLNVSGTLAHSDAANTYKADVSGLATSTQIGAVAEGVWAAENRSLTDKANFTLASSERTSIASAVWASTTRTLSSFGTLVADTAAAVWAALSRTITGTVTVGTNNDKSGYSLQTAPPTAEQIVAAIEADGGTLESIDDALTLLVQIGTADIKVNMTTTPWQEEYYVSGTAMLLFAKKLYDKNGNPVTTEETYAAYKQETTI